MRKGIYPRVCTFCGYPLHQGHLARCPECATPWNPKDPLNYDGTSRSRRSWNVAFRIGLVIWLVFVLFAVIPFFIVDRLEMGQWAGIFKILRSFGVSLVLVLLFVRFIAVPLAYRISPPSPPGDGA